MSKLFIKFFRDEELFLNILNTHFPSYALLSVIAQRVRLSDDIITGLKKGECYIGDYDKMGMSEQQYRTAKANLNKWQFANFKPTNKGTVAFLLPNPIFDIYTTDEITNKQRTANERPTTNKERKNKEDKNIESSTLIISDVNSEKPNLPVPTEFGDPEINAVIKSIKEFCMQHKIIYDSTDDRMYGKHIAKAKEFGALAETMGKSRVELALFIIQIAEQDKFWRGKVCGPAAIYNFRAKILNNGRATYQNQVQNPDVLVI